MQNTSSEDDDNTWPPALRVYCETPGSVIPGVAEFFNALTALALLAAGLLPMLMSPYTDELADLSGAALAINGIFSFLVHAFPTRFYGTIDHISIMFMSLLYLKALLMAYFPVLYRAPAMHTAVNMVLVLTILTASAWNEYNVPKNLAFDPVLVTGPVLLLAFGYIWIKLMYSTATWHVGRLKRVVLSGIISFCLAAASWFIEENGYLPCPTMFTLHPLWHLLSAYALLCWTVFVKYHRGRFFGFVVQIKGPWWAPYVCWTKPCGRSASDNPIIRHSQPARGDHGRRNSYVTAQFRKRSQPTEICCDRGSTSSLGESSPSRLWELSPRLGESSRRIKTMWRGGSFFETRDVNEFKRRASIGFRRGSSCSTSTAQSPIDGPTPPPCGAAALRAFQETIGVAKNMGEHAEDGIKICIEPESTRDDKDESEAPQTFDAKVAWAKLSLDKRLTLMKSQRVA